jgi:hypothetical protein
LHSDYTCLVLDRLGYVPQGRKKFYGYGVRTIRY